MTPITKLNTTPTIVETDSNLNMITNTGPKETLTNTNNNNTITIGDIRMTEETEEEETEVTAGTGKEEDPGIEEVPVVAVVKKTYVRSNKY